MAFDVSFPEIPQKYWIDDAYTSSGSNGHNSTSNNNNNNNGVADNVPISLIAKQLYNDSNIILAFKCLYYKYIDAQNAPFMINLSFKVRERLMKSLDGQYYKQLQLNSKNDIDVKKDRIINVQSRAAIDDEFDFKQGKSVEWLLKKLIVDTDAAAVQLSRLMNDSLYRFKQSVFSAT